MAGRVVANILHNGRFRHTPELENIPYSLDATTFFVKREPSGPTPFLLRFDEAPGKRDNNERIARPQTFLSSIAVLQIS